MISIAMMALSALVGCSDPGPTPPSTEDQVPTYRVNLDGTGDYATLAEAVSSAPEGSHIVLEAGSYVLDEPLLVERAVTLVGAGVAETEIVSSAAGHVVRFAGAGPFGAREITFRREGELDDPVVVVAGGAVAIQGCRFTGTGGARLALIEGTTGSVQASQADSGGWSVGFLVANSSTATLKGNTASSNGYGFQVLDHAAPILEGNRCLDNKLDGIRYEDSAGGVASSNECSGNRSGIVVSGRAAPTLEDNVLTNNAESGIAYHQEGGGVARGNRSSRNLGGVGVLDQAAPLLEKNALSNNVGAGIAYFGDSGGEAVGNLCSDNGVHGIGVFDSAAPTLADNILSNNGSAGLAFLGGTGLARGNQCSGDGAGILIGVGSDPTLEENDCTESLGGDVLP